VNCTFVGNTVRGGKGGEGGTGGVFHDVNPIGASGGVGGDGGFGTGGGVVFQANIAELLNCTFAQNIVIPGQPGEGGQGGDGGFAGTDGSQGPAGAMRFGEDQGGGAVGTIVSAAIGVKNSIFAESPNEMRHQPVLDLGHNISSDGTWQFSATGSRNNLDPKLGPLAANGGFTQTMAVLDGSPAIDAGDDARCPSTDQRGVRRPQRTACDIGAYEVDVSLFPAGLNMNFDPAVIKYGEPVTLSFVVQHRGLAPLRNVSFTNQLPEGMVVAQSPSVRSDCPDIKVTAEPGSDRISVSGVRLSDVQTQCLVQVQLEAGRARIFTNVVETIYSDQTGNTAIESFAVLKVTGLPEAETGFAINLSPGAVRLRGIANSGGFPAVGFFDLGLGADLDFRIMTGEVGSTTNDVSLVQVVEGLLPGTVYQYRAGASNELGVVVGETRQFVTMNPGSGTALSFRNNNSFVEIARSSDLALFPITVSLWFRMLENQTTPAVLLVMPAPNVPNSYGILVANSKVHAWYNAPQNTVNLNGVSSIQLSQWHHVALVVGAEAALYVDGVLETSRALSSEEQRRVASEGPLRIGPYLSEFTGEIDETQIWSMARTGKEIRDAMHTTLRGTESGLVAYWRFDQGSGPVAIDSTGSAHTGLLLGEPIWVASTAPIGQPRLTIARNPDGNFQLKLLNGAFGRKYLLETSPDFKSWSVVTSNLLTGEEIVDLQSAFLPYRFYRINEP
jgi:uncharacterized repeat protein (TIGR01451 family)